MTMRTPFGATAEESLVLSEYREMGRVAVTSVPVVLLSDPDVQAFRYEDLTRSRGRIESEKRRFAKAIYAPSMSEMSYSLGI
jgi:hypothetical protein